MQLPLKLLYKKVRKTLSNIQTHVIEYIYSYTSYFAENMRLQHKSTQKKIYNNTVINYFSTDIFITGLNYTEHRDTPNKKRSVDPQDESWLSIDCLVSQGNHPPYWTTTNTCVGGSSGRIPQQNSHVSACKEEQISNYVTRLTINRRDERYTGKYTCVSGYTRTLSQEFYLTTGQCYYWIFVCRKKF